MGARQKLNQAYVYGAPLWGVAAGMLTQSATVFVIVLAGVLYASCRDGRIRDDRPGRPRRRG